MSRQKVKISLSKTHPPFRLKTNSTYIVFEHIKNGGIPKQLWKQNILTKNQVKYSLSILRKANCIKKISKGVWENIIEKLPKDRLNLKVRTPGVTMQHTPLLGLKSDMVRLHGMRILIKLPKYMKGWKNRKKLLKSLKIKYENIVQGQRISFEEIEKIWLNNNSIYIYFSTNDKLKKVKKPFSWFGETADDALIMATEHIIKFISRLERHLHANFCIGNKYKLRFTNKHYSLIKNAIARRYNEENKRFFGFDDSGCWVLIDNSHNFMELETIHPDTAHEDNEILQGCLNDWKKGITPHFLMEQLSQVVDNQAHHESNIQLHIKAIKDLASGVKKLTGVIDEKKKKRNNHDSMITY